MALAKRFYMRYIHRLSRQIIRPNDAFNISELLVVKLKVYDRRGFVHKLSYLQVP